MWTHKVSGRAARDTRPMQGQDTTSTWYTRCAAVSAWCPAQCLCWGSQGHQKPPSAPAGANTNRLLSVGEELPQSTNFSSTAEGLHSQIFRNSAMLDTIAEAPRSWAHIGSKRHSDYRQHTHLRHGACLDRSLGRLRTPYKCSVHGAGAYRLAVLRAFRCNPQPQQQTHP